MKRIKTINATFVAMLTLVTMLCVVIAPTIGQTAKSELPERKQTSLGLYATASESYDMWKAAPETVKIIDIRTPEEYIFVGHGEMAWNVPAFYQTDEWDADKKFFAMKPNPDFVNWMKELFNENDTLLLTCRSGDRSAIAVNMLAEAGFKKAYTITDGMEGDKVDDPESVFVGQHMKNGWKNSAPWTYKIDPKLVVNSNTIK